MDKIEQVKLLIDKVRTVSIARGNYLSAAREYIPGQMLYMREAHFVVEAGKCPELTMTELAQKLDVTPGAVSQLAKRMEKKGYIIRIAAKEDQRINTVRLTELGEQLYKAHVAYDREKYAELSKHLLNYTPDQIQMFLEFADLLAELFQQET